MSVKTNRLCFVILKPFCKCGAEMDKRLRSYFFPHSPGFPSSLSGFIPSSRGSFPEDSRICQVCGGDVHDRQMEIQMPSSSSSPRSNTDHFHFFPTEVRLNPGNISMRSLSLSVYLFLSLCSVPVQGDSHGFDNTVRLPSPSSLMVY